MVLRPACGIPVKTDGSILAGLKCNEARRGSFRVWLRYFARRKIELELGIALGDTCFLDGVALGLRPGVIDALSRAHHLPRAVGERFDGVPVHREPPVLAKRIAWT